MIFRKRNFAFCLALSGIMGFSNFAAAKAPIVVELFGKNSCAEDTAVQESLQDILKNETDVILINCRTWHDQEKYVKSFTHKFCNERYKAYRKKNSMFAYSKPSPVVVNGRWDANFNDIIPAINLARNDKVKSISMVVHDNMLDVSLPKIESKVQRGEILLYVYVPTQDEEAIFVDSDVALTDQVKEKLLANKSVPFVTKARTSPFYLRPVLAAERMGRWSGEKMDLTFSLDSVSSLTGSSYTDLSYVVVLHEDNEYGSILAAGEAVSLREVHNTLPHSKPADIQFVSPPKDPALQ